MKRYWLTLFPETFLWVKDGRVLIYNTKTRKPAAVVSSPATESLCKALLFPDNLYTIELDQNQLSESMVSKFIEQIQVARAGILVENNGNNSKPVSYAPVFKLQRGTEHLKWEHNLGIGGSIINNLHEITLHINGSKNGNNSFFKQIPYPVNTGETLDIDSIKAFISGCKGGNFHKINILGDIFAYPNFEFLLDSFLSLKIEIHLYVLQEDLDGKTPSFEKLHKDLNIHLIIHDLSFLSALTTDEKDLFFKANFTCVVSSESDIEAISDFMVQHGAENYDLVPLFTGNNMFFFEQFVYTTLEDIENINLSKREVFANMALNIHAFGKLTVMPDGKIYANVNNVPLGSISDPIYDLIYKEMTEGQSWLYIRDMKPCCDCVYQWLCPSPGSYEKVIGKSNLCHVSA
jgi:pseudo-rSAM protein